MNCRNEGDELKRRTHEEKKTQSRNASKKKNPEYM